MASSHSPEIRKDTIYNKWVIFSPARSRRPSDFKSKNPSPSPDSNYSSSCPFCIGREQECAPEIFRIPENTPDWKIRVIENLYPALRRDLPIEHLNPPTSPFESSSLTGFGYHDVVIESPNHDVRLSDLTAQQIGGVLMAYKKRIQQLSGFESIQYVQVFKNHGASAGASMSHSHSQILGLPITPPTVSTRMESMKNCFDKTGKCGLCEIYSEELLIDESSYFFAVVPFAASFPFEIWIIPRDHSSHFHELGDDKATDLGHLLKLMLLKLSRQLNDPPFNFMIHTSPLRLMPSNLPYAHWFLQIVPQLINVAGFEIGSGCYINPVFPEDASKILRQVNITM